MSLHTVKGKEKELEYGMRAYLRRLFFETNEVGADYFLVMTTEVDSIIAVPTRNRPSLRIA